jgi:HEPN domain-containing protein
VERSKDWLDEAEGDLAHAQNDLKGGFYNWACFSAQQAAEKACKAVFQRMGAEAWAHSVADLSLTESLFFDNLNYSKEAITLLKPERWRGVRVV